MGKEILPKGKPILVGDKVAMRDAFKRKALWVTAGKKARNPPFTDHTSCLSLAQNTNIDP